MKVLIINSVCGIRSTGRICTDLAEVLESQGHECKIAYGRETVPEKYQKYAVRIGSELGVRIDGVKTRLLDNAGFNSRRATKRFLKWVREYDPDIIHLHNVHGYYINVELLFNFLKDFGKPVVWTLHDCWAFTGHCAYYSMAQCNKWQTECDKCNRKKSYPQSLFLSRAKRNFEKKKALFTSLPNLTLITPSEWLAGEVRKSFLGKYQVCAIPNGIDLEVFKPTESNFREKYGLENKKIVLGVATAWGERKGVREFADVAKAFAKDFQIVLVGMNEKQAALMPNEILCISETNNVTELAEIYTAADVFLNLGKEETMGLTTVEAMACGTPVVVSNLTAVPEVVSNEEGIVLANLDIKTIIAAVSKAVDGSCFGMIERAKLFEKTTQFMKYVAIYDSLNTDYREKCE